MPKATECTFEGKPLEIVAALELRRNAPRGTKLPFYCLSCGKSVRAHKKGVSGQAAHFEHLERNPACPLSYRT